MQATRFRLAAFAFCASALLAVAACQDDAVTPVESVARPTPTPAQPSPTVAPAATPTPTATPTPAPSATPSPTPAPSATLTPAPTATATATPSPVPTPTPTATVIPAPTPAPTLAPTATPASAPTPAPTAAPSAQQRSSADSSESAPTPDPTRAPAALTPTPTPPVAIPFDQLLPPGPPPTSTTTPTPAPTPPFTIPFDQLLPPGLPPTSTNTPTPAPTRSPNAISIPQGDPGAVPSLPVTFYGGLTAGGEDVAAGTRLHVAISKAGLPDVRRTWVTGMDGRYNFAIAASGYDGGMIEFSLSGQRKITDTYRANAIVVELDLAF